ncbi:type II secretion system protein [Alteribacter aurantiacus]|uniref:type II secretion system protein n=1 Tax=Alteribacter aurantiacus TaxID=254410 RepID=UPI0004054784|nr:type II secretion system protein [Alteribacter aurantiacus]
MKKYDGFTLIEVVIGLFIFSIIAGTVLPVYVSIKQERILLEQERYVHGRLIEMLSELRYDNSKPSSGSFNHNGVKFDIHLIEEDGEWEVCINWDYYGKERSKCLHQ